MAQWNDGSKWSSSTLWGPSSGTASGTANNRRPPRTQMKRQYYYPRVLAARPEWHKNMANKLAGYTTTLPLTTDQVNQGVGDNLMLYYGLGAWITNVRDFAPACTADLRVLEFGTGPDPFAFTTYAAPDVPAIPVGVIVKPGALQRIFDLVKTIKSAPGYTEAIGIDLGIVGEEDGSAPGLPSFTLILEQGSGCQCVRHNFKKNGNYAVAIYSRRGGGAWELLGIDAESPYLDERPLLVAGQPEVREYRMRGWDAGVEIGEWTAVQSVTVGP